MMKYDCRHKHYSFPEVSEQPKSISPSECFRAHVWAGRGCVPPMPVTLPPTHQSVPNLHARPPTQALQEEEPALTPTVFACFAFFPMPYRCIFTTTLHTQPQNLRNVHYKHPWQVHIPCALLLNQKFSRDTKPSFFHSLQISLQF